MKSKVLVIDDDKAMCQLIERMLKKDFSVVAMNDGIQAMHWLISGQMPDLIITDIDMPNLNGLDFISNIRKSGYFKTVPIIVVTGFDDPRQKEKCLALGVSEYFIKPFNPSNLIHSIELVFSATTKI